MSPAAARVVALRLRAAVESVEELAAVGHRPVPGWAGAAADAQVTAAAGLSRRARAVAEVLRELAGQVEAYADHPASGPDLPTAQLAVELDLRHARLALALTDAPGADLRAVRDAVDLVGLAVDPVTGRPVAVHLLDHDPGAFGGDGRVVLAVGDPATAADVAVVVPGLGADAGSAGVLADRAVALHLAARRADPADGNAVVAWIGYDAPAGPGVLTERMADAGGVRLADAVARLRADRAHDPAHLTVVGHSYGATTVSLAATSAKLAADDVVLAGSPGAGDARTAADLGLPPGHVWVLRNSHDPVAALGARGPLGLGEDPALDTWGATRLRAESATRGQGWPVADHTSYFTPGGEGLESLAHVVAGRPDRATRAPGLRDPWWGPPLDPELDRPVPPEPGA